MKLHPKYNQNMNQDEPVYLVITAVRFTQNINQDDPPPPHPPPKKKKKKKSETQMTASILKQYM